MELNGTEVLHSSSVMQDECDTSPGWMGKENELGERENSPLILPLTLESECANIS